MYPYLNRLEKMIREQQFTVRRADREDLKRILAVYFAGDTVSEGYDDFDGQRWLMKDGRSDYRSASVMDEAKVLQTFLDLIAPAAVHFETDRYLMGNTWRCVWAVRGYSPSTEEQAILQRLGHGPASPCGSTPGWFPRRRSGRSFRRRTRPTASGPAAPISGRWWKLRATWRMWRP